MAKPKITVLSLGGTISMVQGKSGVVPGLNADDLIAAAPGIDDLAILTAESRPPVGSSDLTAEGIFDVARRVQELADSGAADGVVITQGTDSLEETSFLMDLLLDPPIPVVMMGAMRHPLAISPDGAGNLAHAVRLASDPRVAKRFRDLGVMVTMLDQAWAAVDVAKANSHRIDAFTAPETGPVAVFLEDRCRLVSFPDRAWKRAVQRFDFLARVDPAALAAKPVALATIAMGEAGGWLSAMAADDDLFGYRGLVLGGLGGGHVPARVVPPLVDLLARVPVVMAGRMGSGYLLQKTYGVPGSEIDLVGRGFAYAGRLPPLKARLLLSLMVAAGIERAEMDALWADLN